jgi:hypothetical protein
MTRNLKRLALAAAIALAAVPAFAAPALNQACYEAMINTAVRTKQSASWDVYLNCISNRDVDVDSLTNTVPFPDFPNPEQACQKEIARGGGDVGSKLYWTLLNKCIAQNQHGYDEAKYIWSHLSQKNAIFCVDAASKIQTFAYVMLGQCAVGFAAAQPLPPQTFNKW